MNIYDKYDTINGGSYNKNEYIGLMCECLDDG